MTRVGALTRRQLVVVLGSGAGMALLPGYTRLASTDSRFAADPFRLGVASGFPTADSVVLWTRLAPAPLEPDGGMPARLVDVQWEIADDEQFDRPVVHGTAAADPQWAHSVHVEPRGLDANRPYWYRFTAGGWRSPIGRTRTAPHPGQPLARLRFAVVSCQHYEQGLYTAYRHMRADDLDLIVHVGDYVYESTSQAGRTVRRHGAPECVTLDDYRLRHALYKTDVNLQHAHTLCPWLAIWDDHEVEDDYANEVSQHGDEPARFLARRAAAYQAYYEHMPLPQSAQPAGPNANLYAQRTYGGLATFFTLDQRQYRSPHACPPEGRRGSNHVRDCAERLQSSRTMLGPEQEAWLASRLRDTRARWNLFAQGTVMTYLDELPGAGEQFWTDGWNGYPAARRRFLDLLTPQVVNPVVLSGDIHSFFVANLNARPQDRSSRVIASELVTTSISSRGLPQSMLDSWRRENPNLLLADSNYRGYLRIDLTAERLAADLVALDSVGDPQAGRHVLAQYVVEDGRPGPVRA
jgi:alkaline phosphatase D